MIKTPEELHCDQFGAFIANFEQLYCSNPVLLLLILNMHLFTAPFILYPANINMFKVNNRSTRTRCEICSKLTIKTSERRF